MSDAPPPDIIGGLRAINALLACEQAYTFDSWARDREGRPLHDVADIRERAASRCLLGAVEIVTHDPDQQQQLIGALCAAIELHHKRPITIVAYTAVASHCEVLAMIATAIDLAATTTWSEYGPLQLPARPPSTEQAAQFALEHQCICELFFASDLHAGQYNATPTLRASARRDADMIAAYLDAHQAWPGLRDVEGNDDAAPVTSWLADDVGDLDVPF